MGCLATGLPSNPGRETHITDMIQKGRGERGLKAWRSLLTIITWDSNWLDSFMFNDKDIPWGLFAAMMGVRKEDTKGNFSDADLPSTNRRQTFRFCFYLQSTQASDPENSAPSTGYLPLLYIWQCTANEGECLPGACAKMCSKSSLKHLLWNRTLWKDSPLFRSCLCVRIDMSLLVLIRQ